MHHKRILAPFIVLASAISLASASICNALESRTDQAAPDSTTPDTRAEKRCKDDGWQKVSFNVANIQRQLLWKGPDKPWRNGAIIVMHGGGGTASNFCSGGLLVKPQRQFTEMAIKRGFAVFALDSTNDKVTDARGRPCGKRFDFMMLDRPNLDLPYIEQVIDKILPANRPPASSRAVFLTGLSTGGYMTIRAATQFDNKITAFAPISAGDPYGTESNCDPTLSARTSAKGILLDNETGKEITQDGACRASDYAREKPWQSANPSQKPPFKQFQDREDGIVDFSCMEKAGKMLKTQDYPDRGAYLIGKEGSRSMWKHLWQSDYNSALLDFLEDEARTVR